MVCTACGQDGPFTKDRAWDERRTFFVCREQGNVSADCISVTGKDEMVSPGE